MQAAPVEPVAAQLAPAVDEYEVSPLVTSGGEDLDVPVRVNDVLISALEMGASDVHLTSGAHPTVRLSGEMTAMDEYPKMTSKKLQEAVYAILTQKQREVFESNLELDFAYQVPGHSRFRVNVYRQRESVGVAFRRIPFEIKPLEDLGVPPVVGSFAGLQRGFVLVTGPTGSGKSTTLASIVDLANRTRKDHIMTVEDPIEFLHRHKSCIVNQREVGRTPSPSPTPSSTCCARTPTSSSSARCATSRPSRSPSPPPRPATCLRHAAHLERRVDHRPRHRRVPAPPADPDPHPARRGHPRRRLPDPVQARRRPRPRRRHRGHGRHPRHPNLIREGKTHQIGSAMQAGAQFGMHTLDQHLAELVRTRQITFEHGLEKCSAADEFRRLTGR